MKWGEIIKNRRNILGISQQELADNSGISLRTIKAIESNDSNPLVGTLEKIGDVLGFELELNIRNTK